MGLLSDQFFVFFFLFVFLKKNKLNTLNCLKITFQQVESYLAEQFRQIIHYIAEQLILISHIFYQWSLILVDSTILGHLKGSFLAH